MPIFYQIDTARQIVEARGEGVVLMQDIVDYLDAVVVQGALPYPKLIDARGTDFSLSDDDMMALGARVSAYAHFGPRGPIAMVVDTMAGQEFSRRFANLGGARRPIKIFRSIDDARTWLQTAPTL
ncbi:MAG TPA: hypothetical protein VMI56_20655 [Reyranella sp.]|nr:hypothetical protein [Reyranella sp.]